MKIQSLLFTLFLSHCIHAQTTAYVCSQGKYEPISISQDAELPFGESIDSIVFTKPEHQVIIDFADIANAHSINTVFIKSNGGEKLADNASMRNYTGNISASDIMKCDVADGQTSIAFTPKTNINNGITITFLCEDNKYLTCYSSSSVSLSGNTFMHTYTFTSDTPARQQNWLATIPSATRFNMLTMPGAHDAATSKVTTSSAKTQNLTIEQQLEAGVRGFDLRPRYNAKKESDIQLENLEIYHGIVATGVRFKDAMDAMVRYLQNNPTETIIVNMQKEDCSWLLSKQNDYSSTWRTSVRTWLQQNSSYVVSKVTSDMTLGSCRGKIVVLSHNPYGTENVYNDIVYGGLISWDDNTKSQQTQINHTWNTKTVDVTVEDIYNTSKTADKQSAVDTNIKAASSDASARWYISYVSIANNPIAYAKTMNSWMLDQLGTYPSHLGILFYDYIGGSECSGSELLHSTIKQNYKYLY